MVFTDLLFLRKYFVNHAIFKSFFRIHPEVTVGVDEDSLIRLSTMCRDDPV